MKKILCFFVLLHITLSMVAQPLKNRPPYDITKDKVLYTIGYAHLDTEWNWEYPTTISEYIKNTMVDNFKLFEKYPDYVFSFTGSRRYKMMKEYYPEMYKKVADYINQGRWFVSGSSVDEGEVNISSSESVLRQVLYGNLYFRKEFNKESVDYMLPDCFGFAATLPSVWSHAGLLGFSTQKLSWGSANGIPFNIGVWKGPDGKGIVAALNATDYTGRIIPRLDLDSTWNSRLQDNINRYGFSFDYRYYGVGDVGGAPRETDVQNVMGSIKNSDSRFKVILTSSDQIYRDITPEIRSQLPSFSGDLLLTEHSAGSMTSQSFMKRANRKNELLAKSSEQAAVISDWLGSAKYPYEKLANAWELILGSQFHDILPGTSTVKAYTYAWNDEFIVSNTLAQVLVNSVAGVTSAMNTQGAGRSIAVYNPVPVSREDIVTVKLAYPKMPAALSVVDKDGKVVPSQVVSKNNNEITLIFLAKLPSAGIAIFDVRNETAQSASALKVSENSLENNYLRVKLNENGDIASVYDKLARREVLSKPATLDFQAEAPAQWPAWNMDWKDRKNPPFDYMNKDVKMRVVEDGPVRVAVEISKKGQNSEITQIVSLSSGEAGKIIDVRNKIDWQSKGVSLKAAFPVTVTNELATYSLNNAAVQRSTNNQVKYEVPGRQWIDLTDKSGSYGVSILEDCKYGSDKPDNSTIRLTLMYTPKPTSYVYQGTQDWGIHEFRYGIYPHSGSWAYAGSPWKGYFLNNPPVAFEVPGHSGELGKEISFVKVNTAKVDVMALKKAEESEYYIVRANELTGEEVNHVSISFPAVITDAYEVNGQEKKIGPANFSDGKLNFDMDRFAIRSFAVKFEKPVVSMNLPKQASVELPFDGDGFSNDNNRKDGNFADNLTMPAELMPASLVCEDITFRIGDLKDGSKNILVSNGQRITLPEGNFNKLYILAAASEDTRGNIKVGNKTVDIGFQKWTGFVGQHYNRTLYFNNLKVGSMLNAFTKRDNIAWFASHSHNKDANLPYEYSYLYKYGIDIPAGTKTITLPENTKIRIAAITVASAVTDNVKPLQLLYDDFTDNKPVQLRWKEYVTESMKPIAVQKPLFTEDVDPRMLPRVKQYLREAGLDTVILKTAPSATDYADGSSDKNITAVYFPVGKSTKGKVFSGEKVSFQNVVNQSVQISDTLLFDNGEGRILIDLGKAVPVDKINMYFENPAARRIRLQAPRNGQRLFSLWISDTNADATGNPAEKGWKYSAIYGGGRNLGGSGTSFIFDGKTQARYIMLVTEGGWHGSQYIYHLDVIDRK
jgi:alpha-mannosidase